MNFTIIITNEQLQVLFEAIGELKYRLAAPLVEAINKQINPQVNKRLDQAPMYPTKESDDANDAKEVTEDKTEDQNDTEMRRNPKAE